MGKLVDLCGNHDYIRCIDGVNHTESDYVSLAHRAQMLSPNCSLLLSIATISVHPHVYIILTLLILICQC